MKCLLITTTLITLTCHGAASDGPPETPSHYPNRECKAFRIIQSKKSYATATKEDDLAKYSCIVMGDKPWQELKGLADNMLACIESKTDHNDFTDICAKSVNDLQTTPVYLALLVKIHDERRSICITDGAIRGYSGSSLVESVEGFLKISKEEITGKSITGSKAAINAAKEWYDIVLDFRKRKTCSLL